MKLSDINERIDRIKYRVEREYTEPGDVVVSMRDDLVWSIEVIAQLEEEKAALKLDYVSIENRTSKRIYELEQGNAALKRENKRLRGFLDTVMLNWEKHRVYKALLTAEDHDDQT